MMVSAINATTKLQLLVAEKLSPFLAQNSERIRQAIVRYGRSAPRDAEGRHDRFALLSPKRKLSDDEKIVLLAAIHDRFCTPSACLLRNSELGDTIEATLASGYLPYQGIVSAASEFADMSVQHYQLILHLVEVVPLQLVHGDRDQHESKERDCDVQIRLLQTDLRSYVEHQLGSLLDPMPSEGTGDADAGKSPKGKSKAKPKVSAAEANIRAIKTLRCKPPNKASWSIRSLAKSIGCSSGLVHSLSAWQVYAQEKGIKRLDTPKAKFVTMTKAVEINAGERDKALQKLIGDQEQDQRNDLNMGRRVLRKPIESAHD